MMMLYQPSIAHELSMNIRIIIVTDRQVYFYIEDDDGYYYKVSVTRQLGCAQQ